MLHAHYRRNGTAFGRPFLRKGVRIVGALLLGLPLAAGYGRAAAGGYDWLQFDGSGTHSGSNTAESVLSAQSVVHLHRVIHVHLPSVADGAPAFLSGVSTQAGTRSLLFLTTHAGHILALDAGTGSTVWSHQYPAGSCTINGGGNPCYTTSSPAVGPKRGFVYAYGLDGRVHKLAVGSGKETVGGGWPEVATVKPWDEKGSAALSIATSRAGIPYLYVANGGYPGDAGDYQGHITAINLTNSRQNVFNTLCSNKGSVHFGSGACGSVQSAVWARAAVVYDPDTDRIYFSTGNGSFNPAQHNWGDSVLALSPDAHSVNGNPVDSYTPADYQQLDNSDADLGSTAPAILPAPASSHVKHLGVQSGKDQRLRLINLDNLSGRGGPGFTGGEVGSVIDVPQGGEVLTQPAVWKDAQGRVWVFVANSNGISGLTLTVNASTGIPALHPIWTNGNGGTSPVVANGVLYYAGGSAVRALNPTTGKQLWSDTSLGGIHWESPIVANGRLYVTDGNGYLNGYAP